MLAYGKSDCQWGYYFTKGSLDEVYDYLIDINTNMICAYIDADTPDEILEQYADMDEDEKEELEFNCRTYKRLVNRRMSEESLSKCRIYISDSDLKVLVLTEKEEVLRKKCLEIAGVDVEGLPGEKAANYLLEHYTTWNS